jgi:hypothetical protein
VLMLEVFPDAVSGRFGYGPGYRSTSSLN